jgi:hypothetical protein
MCILLLLERATNCGQLTSSIFNGKTNHHPQKEKPQKIPQKQIA